MAENEGTPRPVVKKVTDIATITTATESPRKTASRTALEILGGIGFVALIVALGIGGLILAFLYLVGLTGDGP